MSSYCENADWDNKTQINAVTAQEFEKCGVQAITIHGRTRDCSYKIPAEYDTVKKVKESIKIPVLLNGDISDGKVAALAIEKSGADGIMIGRGACGNPWIFSMIRAYLNGVEYIPDENTILDVLENYIDSLYSLYGSNRVIRAQTCKMVLLKSINQHGEPAEFNKLKDVFEQKLLTKIREKIV